MSSDYIFAVQQSGGTVYLGKYAIGNEYAAEDLEFWALRLRREYPGATIVYRLVTENDRDYNSGEILTGEADSGWSRMTPLRRFAGV